MADTINIPTRDQLVRRYERDYQVRLPGADVGDGTTATNDAKLLADQHLELYAHASNVARNITLADKTEADLSQELSDLGLPDFLPAVGASGFVNVTTSLGGAPIQAGTIAKNLTTGLRYACQITGTYTTATPVPVQCVDAGPNTDVAAGTILEWQSPPAGLSSTAIVAADAAGNGLTGGRARETREGAIQRIRTAQAHPAVAGNDADYLDEMSKVPGLGVQARFVYPCIKGNGTIGIAFTLRPSKPGASRIPNAAQIAQMRAGIVGAFPGDDSVFAATVVSHPVDLALTVRWVRGKVRWADAVPWPAYDNTAPDGRPVLVTNATTPTATQFTLARQGTGITKPNVGATLAFLDRANNRFVQKRIGAVSGATNGPWLVDVDTTNGVSDLAFVPSAGDPVSPWSDGLNSLVVPILEGVDALGPGEQVASFYDSGGRRQKRVPDTGEAWPNELSGRLLIPLYSVPGLDEVQVAGPAFPYVVPVGTLGVSVNLIEVATIAILPI